MTNTEIIQAIRTEIERLKGYYRITNPYDKRAIRVCENLLSFLSTLESERLEPYNPVYDEAYLNEKIKKATESWKGVDVDAMLAECRGYDEEKSEKPIIPDIEKELARFYLKDLCGSEKDEIPEATLHHNFPIMWDDLRDIARHFAKWGAERQKEQDDKELSDLLTIAHLQGADQMKEQMLKDAVKAFVLPLDKEIWCNELDKFPELKEGEKVKLIIIKENEK